MGFLIWMACLIAGFGLVGFPLRALLGDSRLDHFISYAAGYAAMSVLRVGCEKFRSRRD